MLFAQILYLRQPVGFRITADESETTEKETAVYQAGEGSRTFSFCIQQIDLQHLSEPLGRKIV